MAASTYKFFPWARRGLADKMTTADQGQPLPARSSVSVGLVVTGVAAPTYSLAVYGPGDVVGVDTTLIVRVDPRPNASDVEANFFPAIEFDASDFPWMFTPAMNDPTTNQLRPWCVLIVVDLAVVAAPTGQAGSPLPVVVIPGDARATELPDLVDSWAWAHTQMVTATSTAGDDLTKAITAEPAMNVSRIMAPRRLEPNKRYAACLVPAFDAGVERGLGGAPTATTISAAWKATETGDVKLPVYFHWEFSTGPAGDFETLARRLKPALPPNTAGIEPMYVGAADPALPKIDPSSASAYIDMDGPLRAPDRSNMTIADVPQTIQAGLAKVLNATSDQVQNSANAPASVLGPPIYGSWQANQHTIPAQGAGWLRELNLDPRTRAAAGLGAEIERRNQEDFMDWAWEQVGDVLKANALLSRSRLSMETLIRVHTRHVATLPIDRALQFSAPMLRRVPQVGTAGGGTSLTVRAAIEHSSVPNSVVDPALRRLISPRSATVRAAARHAPPAVPGNTGIAGGILGTIGIPIGGLATAAAAFAPATLAATPAPASANPTAAATAKVASPLLATAQLATFATTATGAATTAVDPTPSAPTGFISKLSAGQLNVDLARFTPDGIAGMPDLSAIAAPTGTQMSLASTGLPLTVAAASFTGAQTAAKAIVAIAHPIAPAATFIAAAIGSTASVTAVKAASLNQAVLDDAFVGGAASLPVSGKVTAAATSKLAAARPIAGAALPISKEPITKEPVPKDPVVKPPIVKDPPIVKQPADPTPVVTPPATAVAPAFVPFALSTARDSVVARTNPRSTVLARIQTMLNIGSNALIQPPKNTGIVPPILTKPIPSVVGVSGTFDRIMAAPDLTVPVYRYLADMDPTRFMPGVGDVPNDSMMLLETNPRFVEALLVGLNYEMNRELLWREYPTDQRGTPFKHFWGWSDGGADIDPINTWTPANALGSNSRGGSGGQIVMLVRGNLLRRYPNTSIYAWRSASGRLINPPGPTDVKKPVFTGVLGSDIAFAGFDLTDSDLQTGDGWFFVLQQQPTEPRFGFDEGTGAPQQSFTSWSDANWDDTGTAPGQYLQIKDNRLTGAKHGDATFVSNAAHLATITIQKPVAVALSSKVLTTAVKPATPK
ncbi:MAG TPA: hypothetical protein VGM82_00655 [Gemmatimonadaceae bacterium]|jgi:hypothetical protein